jgi:hypothetical protein
MPHFISRSFHEDGTVTVRRVEIDRPLTLDDVPDYPPVPVYVIAPRWHNGSIIGNQPALAVARFREPGRTVRLVVVFPDGKVDVPIRPVHTYPNANELETLPLHDNLFVVLPHASEQQFYDHGTWSLIAQRMTGRPLPPGNA